MNNNFDLHVNLDQPLRTALVISQTNNNQQQNVAAALNDLLNVRVFFYNENSQGELVNTALEAGAYLVVAGAKKSVPGTELFRAESLTQKTEGSGEEARTHYYGELNLTEQDLIDAIGAEEFMDCLFHVQVSDSLSPTATRRTLVHEKIVILQDYATGGSSEAAQAFTPSVVVDWTQAGVVELIVPDPYTAVRVQLTKGTGADLTGMTYKLGSEDDDDLIAPSGTTPWGDETQSYVGSYAVTGGKVKLEIETPAAAGTEGRIALVGVNLL